MASDAPGKTNALRDPPRRPPRPRTRERTSAAPPPQGGVAGGGRLALPVVFFLLALAVPFVIQLGGLRLSIYRIILIVMIAPLLFMWLSGRAGRIRIADISLILLSLWASVSLAVVHDIRTGIEGGGIFFTETVGAFLLARCFVRNEEAFRMVVRVLFLMVLALSPFAIIEAVTGQNLLMSFFSLFGPTHSAFRMEPRLGLERVQATFEHPILFGVFCASLVGLTGKVLGYRKGALWNVSATSYVIFVAFLSLSSGPLAGILIQILFILYDYTFRMISIRWWAALVVGSILGAILEVFSNRTLPEIFIAYFALSQYTAYLRILIWEFGVASIMAHPWFGIGFNEYERASWMSFSIDMFWIVFAVRHGIIAWFFTFLAFFAVLLPVIFKRGLTDRQAQYRLGFVFSMIGLFLCGWTVHLWNAIYVLFLFLLGSGVWLLDVDNKTPAAQEAGAAKRPPRKRPRPLEPAVS